VIVPASATNFLMLVPGVLQLDIDAPTQCQDNQFTFPATFTSTPAVGS
jgi:hypothetical protein